MSTNNVDALATLKSLAAAMDNRTTRKADSGDTSFKEIFSKMQEEQEKWDSLMDEMDIAQYKLALTDSFWSDRANPQKYLNSYLKRHNSNLGLEAINTLTANVSLLNHLNSLSGLTGTTVDMRSVNQSLSKALASAIMTGIRT